ncbi:MAG: hypothetical protein B7Y86_09985 [Brevundimonas subvibrioides]|uniref:Uncharacterized protein n=1 Tax=Brevundimonas subvibrioides TaxID=74313 RepID=A0A258HJ93_9CAUL|nr:hypothetical protein [Brevundimonas subvibrioides]OYX57051.1 MAG: hypothetical protein B7Y86_09985 [Brevundimonas subvibrioides]
MRVSGLLLGFSAGVYLMWKVAVPSPDASLSCSVAPDCAVATAASPDTARAAQAGLQVVVYDPETEPRDRTHDGSHIPGWTSSEETSVADRPVISPASDVIPLQRLRIVGLDQANAHGACAVLGERKLGCLGLTNLGEQ